MRVSRQRAAENRERILSVASRLFREQGIGSTGVDVITERAGLTHGAFYSQFGSKEAVAAEAVRLAFEGSLGKLAEAAAGRDAADAFAEAVRAYLAPEHVGDPGGGCVVAALGGDVARQPKRVREAFTAGLETWLARFAELAPAEDAAGRRDEALATFACMAGAVVVARAVSDPALAKRILRAVARRLSPRASKRADGRRSRARHAALGLRTNRRSRSEAAN